MKILSVIACAGAATLVVLGVAMAGTKPSRAEYEEYATQRLSEYIKEQGCNKAPNLFSNFIKLNCGELVDSANPQIKQVIKASTEKRDYLLFSVYHTNLEINSLIPSYKFETVGAFDNFFTYKAQKNKE